MFGILSDLARATVATATLPVSVARDVVNVVTLADEDANATVNNVNRIVDNLDNASKPRS